MKMDDWMDDFYEDWWRTKTRMESYVIFWTMEKRSKRRIVFTNSLQMGPSLQHEGAAQGWHDVNHTHLQLVSDHDPTTWSQLTEKETWTVCGPSKFMEHHGTVHTWGTWSCVCPISIDFWHCKVKRIKTQYSCGLMEQNWPFTHHLFFHFRTNPVAVVHLVFSTQVLETPSELQQLTAKWQQLDTIVASGFASHPRVALPSSFRLFRQSIPSLNLPSKYLKILQAHGHCGKTHLNNMVQDFAGTNGLPNICAVGIIGQTSVTSFAGMVMFHHASTHGWLPKYPNSTVHLSNPFLLNAPPSPINKHFR